MPPPSPSEFFQVVRKVTELLDDLEVPFHLTGGLISSYYGDPRFTQDIDLVIKLDVARAVLVSARLGLSFQLDMDSVIEAAEDQGMFQAYDRDKFVKIDFHVGEEIPGELSRSRSIELAKGVQVNAPCVEDAIASKLYWISLGSHKSRQDVVGMLQGPETIDFELLEATCGTLGLLDLLAEMRHLAEE